jgi:hypothetical protein
MHGTGWGGTGVTATHAQDAWDWMGQHWCDRAQTLWPVEQMENAPLSNNRPAQWLGALYHHARRDGVYTQRSLFYAQLWQQLRYGHDPWGEVDWDLVRPFPACILQSVHVSTHTCCVFAAPGMPRGYHACRRHCRPRL